MQVKRNESERRDAELPSFSSRWHRAIPEFKDGPLSIYTRHADPPDPTSPRNPDVLSYYPRISTARIPLPLPALHASVNRYKKAGEGSIELRNTHLAIINWYLNKTFLFILNKLSHTEYNFLYLHLKHKCDEKLTFTMLKTSEILYF